MYYLGVDAGGTKCSARLIRASGQIIGCGLSGPANLGLGVKHVFSAIQDAYQQAINEANLDPQDICKIYAGIGVAGISRIGAKEQLLAQPFPFFSTHIENDGFIANIGAHAGQDGGIVIVGTGSIAIGKVGSKNIRIGGYGFPISDEGSGAYIGLQIIRTTLRAADRRIPHSQLTSDLIKKYNNSTECVVDWMDNAGASEYANLAPLVMQAAKAGDKYGRGIIQGSAKHIDQMVRSLHMSGVLRCALSGGVSTVIRPWLSPDIRSKLVKPKGDALDGALWLARL